MIVSDRYGVSSGYTYITIPNNNVYQPTYSQDGTTQLITFDAETGTEYYICVNIGATSNPSDVVEGFFTISVCTELTHALTTEQTVITEPSCETAGIVGNVCNLCDQATDLTEQPALGHNFGEEIVLVETDCTTAGMNGRICSTCGSTEVTASFEASGHIEGDPVEVRTPTCTEDGDWEYYCTVCGELTNRVTIPALGHQSDAYVTIISATCTTDGLRTQSCTVCYETLVEETIPALGHVPGELVQVQANDIMQSGLLTSSCHQCGEVMDSIELPAIGSYQIQQNHPSSYYSIENENLSIVPIADMEQSENHVGANMTAYIQGNKLVIEENSDSMLSNLAYVPFTVSACVPANSCFVATYTFDLSSDKRASGGTAKVMSKLIDLGYADIQNNDAFDAEAPHNGALLAFVSDDHSAPATGSITMKVVFNNNSAEAQVINHYFALFSGINYASTYTHRLLTELTITATLEDITASYAEADLVELINSLNQ